jgi:hypothetical protein
LSDGKNSSYVENLRREGCVENGEMLSVGVSRN